jgi:hypothetical protein
MSDDATPTGWRKAEQPDDTMTRYSAQPVTEYEHIETDVGIQLIPSDPQTESASEAGYRINLLSDSADNSSDIELLTNAADHEAALGVARRFMDAYNDQCVEGNAHIDTVVQEFSEPD